MPKTTTTQALRLSRTRTGRPWRCKPSEGGAIAVMAAFVIIIMVAMFGFALDLSRTYNRKVELQSVADNAALAAANALDGTSAGVDNAVSAAASTAANFSIAYNNSVVTWSAAALRFGTSPDGGAGGWVDGSSAKAAAGQYFYARVDTSMLDPSHGRIENVLISVLSPSLAVTDVTASAVAGRDTVKAMPLGICAISNTPAVPGMGGELVEYGFRRGIGYDLLKPDPSNAATQNFLINPIAPAGTVGVSMMGDPDTVAAYVCTGKMAIPALQGGAVTVEPGFPLGSLYRQFNARFGTYVTPCQSTSAPADQNTRSFDAGSATWMGTTQPNLSVGPLWSYAKAARYASYSTSRGVEPATGYTTFATTDWSTLYPGPPAPAAQNYPATTPYQSTGGAASYKTVYNTRVLRIPLLQCPVTAGPKVTATVIGIGKFFMTVPATSSALTAEFAGAESWTAIGGNARLYR